MKTREEYVADLQTIEQAVRKQVREYNTAYADGKFDEVKKINAETEKEISNYAEIAQMLCFDECAGAENPMIAAVLTLSYPVITIRDKVEGDGEVKTLKREFVEDENGNLTKYKTIDLLKFERYVKDRTGHGIGADPKWSFMIERLNLLFALDCAVGLGKGQEFIDEMKDCYAINEASKEINFGVKDPKAGTPISNTGLLKAVSAVVTAMIGEEYGKKALTHDVKFLKIASAKKSKKALTIQCANHKFMRSYLAEVCNRIITGGVYDVEYKKVKAK